MIASKCRLFIALFSLLLTLPFLCPAQVQPSSTGISETQLPETKIKELGIKAAMLAQARLSADSKDKLGLILVKFANHLHPKYKPLLLLRASLKYNVKIQKPSEELSEKEFLAHLLKITQSMGDYPNNERARSLLVTCYALLREFQPDNEDALITLMAAEDSGQEVSLEKIFQKSFWEFQNVEYDPKDNRYVVSNVQKTIFVSACMPWTDTWVKVSAGKVIRVKASGDWCVGSLGLSRVGPEGYDGTMIEKIVGSYDPKKPPPRTVIMKKYKGELEAKPGSLIAKIGNRTYAVGDECVFTAAEAGILYFGPYELDGFDNNSGQLAVTITISDK